MKKLVAFSVLLHLATSVEITICDCSTSTVKGFLKNYDKSCNSENLLKPETAYYEIYTYKDKVRFTGHFCLMKSKAHSTDVHIDTTSTNKQLDLPVRPKLGGCLRMAGLTPPGVNHCFNKQTMTRTGNKWIYHRKPSTAEQFLHTSASIEQHCLYEPITLNKACYDCNITSVLGPIEKIEQTEEVNGTIWQSTSMADGTLIWRQKDSFAKFCTKKLLENDMGFAYAIDKDTFRISNPKRQIDLIISKVPTSENECNISLTEEEEYWAPEMPGIIVKLYMAEKDPAPQPTVQSVIKSEETIISATLQSTSTTPSTTTSTTRTTTKTTIPSTIPRRSRDLRTDIKETGHLSFIRNTAVADENIIVDAIRTLQCESRQNRFSRAMLTAKSNGWLAAKQLGYPDCSRLVPIGTTARLEFCQANVVSLSVEHTACGPQPKVSNNLTVNINGFETAKLTSCYHKGNLVNLNGHPYSFQSGDWIKLPQTIPLNSEGFINKFAFEADNSLETFIKVDPDFVGVNDQISVLADIVGIINEHTPDVVIKTPHASSALIPSHEKENHSLLQGIATWLSYFGGILIAIVAGLIVFKLCGGQPLLRQILSCIGLPPWASKVLSGNFLALCTTNQTKNATDTFDLSKNTFSTQPSTIIEINPTLMDDDSLERQSKRSRSASKRNGNPKRKSSKKRNRNSTES